ncbi:hypothetical protein OIU74_015870 [Salix koriyanagi]|uniref:Uncharacterized protein n=1 Tax=Salix koriyanagi TaxID=2511006 RepID=A0A9Q0PN43_9ROSI|nr:hypothetical protein OIU74_015870 [Salix koriyanagi]
MVSNVVLGLSSPNHTPLSTTPPPPLALELDSHPPTTEILASKKSLCFDDAVDFDSSSSGRQSSSSNDSSGAEDSAEDVSSSSDSNSKFTL